VSLPAPASADREAIGTPSNPLGLEGIEYVEIATRQPQATGQVLERLGFKPVARHRSREVMLYRQGGMNLVVNAQPAVLRDAGDLGEAHPRVAAVAVRVRDARAAFERACKLGAWEVATHAQVMELNIPGIHGPGQTQVYFVDRWRDFSIFDVDFTRIPGVDPHPPALEALHLFGLVQYIGTGRTGDWHAFWRELFGFVALPPTSRFGVLPKGQVLASPGSDAHRWYVQLIEPETPGVDETERFERLAFGTPRVEAVMQVWQGQGFEFAVGTDGADGSAGGRGALTRPELKRLSFELVHDLRHQS
jgi:4-hydroxyphenylpyruvate dioxygenase